MRSYCGTLSVSFDIPFCIEAIDEEDAEKVFDSLDIHSVLKEYGMNTKYISNANIDAGEWEEE